MFDFNHKNWIYAETRQGIKISLKKTLLHKLHNKQQQKTHTKIVFDCSVLTLLYNYKQSEKFIFIENKQLRHFLQNEN